jgi:hypothetical protein
MKNNMKVKIMQRSVYHKVTEYELELPKDIDEFDVQDYINDNEHLWVDKIDQQMSETEYEYGFGMDSDDGWTDKDQTCEWRYEIKNKNYGGHL